MCLISKDAVQAAFDNADPDVLADYGCDGFEYGFSRTSIRIILAEVAGYAILSPYVNDHGDLEYLLDYHRRDTCMDYDADLPVVYLDDCYPSQMAAHHALDEEVGEDDC